MVIETKELAERLALQYCEDHPADAALTLSSLPIQESIRIFTLLPEMALVDIWEHLPINVQEKVFKKLPETVTRKLLMEVDPGLLAILLAKFSKAKVDKILSIINESTREIITGLLKFPGRTAGYLMDANIISFNQATTVKQALSNIKYVHKQQGHDYFFVVDNDLKLLGQLNLSKLLFAQKDDLLKNYIFPLTEFAYTLEPEKSVLEKIEHNQLEFLPIIDGNKRFAGIVHGAKIIDAVKEDVVADMQAMVGVSKDEQALSSSMVAVRKRLPWLHINLITAFLASAVVGLFEDIIAQYTALAVLLPIASGQSGNSGSQALAVTMRGLALREISLRHWLKVTFKETWAGFINGATIAITCGVGVYIWSRNEGLALVIGISMIVSMTIAGIAGALIPLGLQKFGQDPAQSSSIILTTITDIVGFFSFLGTAFILSGIL